MKMLITRFCLLFFGWKDCQWAFHIVLFHLFWFLIAVSLCTCRHSNEEYYFYSTFDRITSGDKPAVMRLVTPFANVNVIIGEELAHPYYV